MNFAKGSENDVEKYMRQFVKFREKMQNKKVPELRKDFIFKYGKSVRCLMYFSKRQTKYEE